MRRHTYGAWRNAADFGGSIKLNCVLAFIIDCGVGYHAKFHPPGSRTKLHDNCLDLAVANNVFSCILDDGLRHELAAEMWRTIKPGAWCMIFDVRICGAFSTNVRVVTRLELDELKQLDSLINRNWRPIRNPFVTVQTKNGGSRYPTSYGGHRIGPCGRATPMHSFCVGAPALTIRTIVLGEDESLMRK